MLRKLQILRGNSKMDHSELISEMAHVEHMSTQERLHLARRRRNQQLKLWAQREKEWQRHRSKEKLGKPKVYFSDSVMLLEAASRNDIGEVRRLLMKGVNPDSTNEDGLTALHQCCIDDNEEMMKLLLEFGANVNAEDSEKWTPLHAAATCGHLHLVRYLIKSGANLLAVNADGNMAYDICEDEAALEHIESEMARRGVTQELIDETRSATESAMLQDLIFTASVGGDLDVHDEQGATPLHIGAANGYLRVVEFLLDQHVSTDVKDYDGWQPVHAAACWGHMEVLELLVQSGADLNARTKHDETPADICEDPELRERIIELKSEQETKRLQEAQRRRVRRSQSTSNTRTQSVRRTSIRDKTLTSKKDAVEEARLRRQAQEVFIPPVDIPDVGIKVPAEAVIGNTIEMTTLPKEDHWDSNGELILGRREPGDLMLARREPEGKDDDNVCTEDESKAPTVELPTEASYTTEGNGKINIHVSVTINAGTLAELKKQRAQNRNSSPDVSVIHQQSSSRSSLTGSENLSPAVKRFAGNTGDNVIGDTRVRRCCIIS